jgi:hypothetical protein
MVNAICLLVALLFIDLLGLTWLLYWSIIFLHSDNLRKHDVVSILIGMLHAIQESHQALLLITDVFDHSLERLFSVVVIHLMDAQVSKVDAAHTPRLRIDELDIGSSAQ